MHVYFISYNFRKNTPSTRYRGTYPLIELEKHNIKTTQFHRKQDIFYLFSIYIRILLSKEKNIVIFQRIVQKDKISRLMELIRKTADKSILDIDDAIEDLTSKQKNKDYIFEWIRKVNQVWVGSKELKENYSKYNNNIKLMTTPVPKVKINNKTSNTILTIGWIGNYKPHKDNLEMFFTEIKNIDITLNIKLVGISNKDTQHEILAFFKETSISIEFPIVKNWNNEQEISNIIQTFDIGIMPQLNTKYDRAKSAFKIKQYFASGIPALASPVGENFTVINDNINGYLVKNGDWSNILKIISSHKDTLKNLKKHVLIKYKKSDYYMENYIQKLIKLCSTV